MILAQISFSNGNHNLEISGMTTTYYNYRDYKSGETDFEKNRFKLRDAQIQLEGRVGKDYEYELQFDIVDLALGSNDPENPGLMDAYFIYKGLEILDIKVGYGKVPYSRSSLVPFAYSPYFQRAELARGEFFNRRDVGVTLQSSLLSQRLNIYAGTYTGLGERTLRGDNDASGNLEVMGRIDFAYPSRYRYRDIDTRHVPVPMFAIGLNGRYSNKFVDAREGLGLAITGGEKYTYGVDFSFQYKGFSAQLELHQLRITPNENNIDRLQGFEGETDYFLAGAYLAQLNYYAKPLKSVFSVRFDELDQNDLVRGNTRRLSFAYMFMLDSFNSAIKMQFTNILDEEETGQVIDDLNWDSQFRIGWQLMFR